MKHLMPLAALCVSLGAAALVPAQDERQAREFAEMIKKPLAYDVQPDRVAVRENVTVGKRADGSALTVDLYLPKAAPSASLPVALLVHGGLPDIVPVKPTDWRMYRDWGNALAQSGIAAVMFDHSMGFPTRRLDQALAEIGQVMSWLRNDARGLDASRLSIVSFSAGALFVPELARRYDATAICGYVMFYPLVGIDADQDNDAGTARRMRLVDALPRLAQQRTPVVIFRAGADQIPGLLPRLDAAVTAALTADLALQVVNLPGAPHGFDFLRDAQDTRDAIQRTIEFALARAADAHAVTRN